jgi:hypothetical protein
VASHDDTPPQIVDTRDTLLTVLVYPDGRCLISSAAKTADGQTDHARVAETLLRALTETGHRRVPGVTVACPGCATQVPVEEDRSGAWSFAPHPIGMVADAPLCLAGGKPHGKHYHSPRTDLTGNTVGCVCGADSDGLAIWFESHIRAAHAARQS